MFANAVGKCIIAIPTAVGACVEWIKRGMAEMKRIAVGLIKPTLPRASRRKSFVSTFNLRKSRVCSAYIIIDSALIINSMNRRHRMHKAEHARPLLHLLLMSL